MKVKFYLDSWHFKEIYEILDFEDLWIDHKTSKEKIDEICENYFNYNFLNDYVEGWYFYDEETEKYIFYVEWFDERSRIDYSKEDLWIKDWMNEDKIEEILSSVYEDYLWQFDQWFIINPKDRFLSTLLK